LFRILAILAFFSGAVQSADQTLLVYYLEERVGFGDSDVAKMFLIFGILGIFAQVSSVQKIYVYEKKEETGVRGG